MQTLQRLGFMGTDGVPTARAAFWVPLAGSLVLSGGVALWLFS